MKKNTLKISLTAALALAAAAAALYLLPVPFTILEKTGDAGLKPYGEILPGNPLSQCASEIGDYGRYGRIRLELYLATYGRINTSRYAVQAAVVGGEKYVLHREAFSAADVQDNEYRIFEFNPMSKVPGRLCFTMETGDAVPGNALTVWQNGNSDPVYRITAFAPLSEVLARMAGRLPGEPGRNVFGLGPSVLFGLFFACLFAYVWLVIYLAGALFERSKPERKKHAGEKIPKPAHRQRTGQS